MPSVKKLLVVAGIVLLATVCGSFLALDRHTYKMHDGAENYQEIQDCIELGGSWSYEANSCRRD